MMSVVFYGHMAGFMAGTPSGNEPSAITILQYNQYRHENETQRTHGRFIVRHITTIFESFVFLPPLDEPPIILPG